MEVQTEKVKDEDRLLRRVWYPSPSHVRDDMTVTSLAFKLRKNKNETGLSVDIERLTTLDKAIIDISRFRLFRITTANVRFLGCECSHLPESDNYAHAEITGHITNSISSQLAKAAVFVKFP